jgi:hypothetical protein
LRKRLRKLLIRLGLVSLFSYLAGPVNLWYIYDRIRMRRRRIREEKKKIQKIEKMMKELRKPEKK